MQTKKTILTILNQSSCLIAKSVFKDGKKKSKIYRYCWELIIPTLFLKKKSKMITNAQNALKYLYKLLRKLLNFQKYFLCLSSSKIQLQEIRLMVKQITKIILLLDQISMRQSIK